LKSENEELKEQLKLIIEQQKTLLKQIELTR